MINSNELRHLQLCELQIAKEIKRICDKHGIVYVMTCGTLLGAVRHSGFIPWDDDIDFAMERSEYDRFCSICEKELGQDYFLQTWDTDKEYPFSFAKVRLLGTQINEEFTPKSVKNTGIFVDVFPLDNVPDDEMARKKQKFIYYFLRRILWMKKGYGKCIKTKDIKGKIKYFVFFPFTCLCSYEYVKSKFEKQIKKYNGCNTNLLVADSIYSFEKNSIRREWLTKIKEYTFEDSSFTSFADYDAFLTHIFGDYMELPPEDRRHNHSIKDVEFGIF